MYTKAEKSCMQKAGGKQTKLQIFHEKSVESLCISEEASYIPASAPWVEHAQSHTEQ